ncbi:universal bacterial protein YeaZ [Synechococcus sp. PCC 7502]|uniref:tRNA (adenosine(37)-N6)-threonylcarbamoyltransferase complex dimerization subunit type 1 TsaB n=1 Tax=Synechococcus sp. PCC 7502 TaxID=1173263 RepID=UPI00029FB167|nr:tRNA (adenosine(37)-N6)-threonylcarbamoyltransferase complex dimerization subunit type 1 TsaB [Synechococcus sp. PCC 7502]AFY74546.1 universal bacterial protein YeaZ [Synechococcus sp. PCC 7502]
MPQTALAIDSTTEVLELAIAQVSPEVNPLICLNYQKWTLGRDLSVQIHTCLAEVMSAYQWSDLAFLAIASGVGSFTSTRIGIVVARTLGEQLGIPVYAISCNDINSQAKENNLPIMSLIKIGHNHWVTGEYRHWSEALPLYS